MSKPGTIRHFTDWAAELVLDTGETWQVERWQREFIDEILRGKPAAWLVVPEGNGKTTMMAALALYALDVDGWGHHAPMIVVAAAARDQAEWLYLQAEIMVMSTEGMKSRFQCLPGKRRISRAGKPRERKPGRIQIFAADDRTADGAIFDLGIIDELHNHRDLRLWRRWRGKLDKKGGQIVAISTAGEPGTEFEEARGSLIRTAKTAERGCFIRAEDEAMVLHDWALRDRTLVDNMREVAKANPRKALTAKTLRMKHPEHDKATTIEHFMRFSANIATRIEGAAVRAEDWEACMDSELVADPTVPCYGGVDLGFSQDYSAVVVVAWEGRERRTVAYCKLLRPPVKQGQIARALVEAQKRFAVESWAIDLAAGARVMVQLLEDGQHPDQDGQAFHFTDYPQQAGPLGEAAIDLDEAIRNRWIVHDGDPELRKHVLNAVRKPSGVGRWRFGRPSDLRRTRVPIDGLDALSFANRIAVMEEDMPKAKLAMAFA